MKFRGKQVSTFVGMTLLVSVFLALSLLPFWMRVIIAVGIIGFWVTPSLFRLRQRN